MDIIISKVALYMAKMALEIDDRKDENLIKDVHFLMFDQNSADGFIISGESEPVILQPEDFKNAWNLTLDILKVLKYV